MKVSGTVMSRMAAPIRQARAEVSPMEPGIVPIMAESQVVVAVTVSIPSAAAWASGVAPEKPSTVTHTESPEI